MDNGHYSDTLLAFEAVAVAGPDREEIPLDDVFPGDEVVLRIQHDNFGSSVLEIHRDPPAPDDDGVEPF